MHSPPFPRIYVQPDGLALLGFRLAPSARHRRGTLTIVRYSKTQSEPLQYLPNSIIANIYVVRLLVLSLDCSPVIRTIIELLTSWPRAVFVGSNGWRLREIISSQSHSAQRSPSARHLIWFACEVRTVRF